MSFVGGSYIPATKGKRINMSRKAVMRRLEGLGFSWLPPKLKIAWQGLKTKRKMDRQFGRHPDPFNYEGSQYERMRFEVMEEAVGGGFQKALEAGCAEGHFTQRLARHVQELTCLDISEIALERAKKCAPNARFILADLLSWEPPPKERYDLIVLADVLYYLDRPIVAAEFNLLFGRIASWLNAGGRIVLAGGAGIDDEPTLNNRKSFSERFQKVGLELVSEKIAVKESGVRCLVSVIEKPFAE